jgi:hypothetical protein
MFSMMKSSTDTPQDDDRSSGSAQKRQRYALLVTPKGVAEDARLSPETKTHYIKRLAPLWAVKDACPRGSMGHKDATAEIIAVTKEVMADARECVVKKDQAQSQAQTMHPGSDMIPDSSPIPADPVDTTPDIAVPQPQPAEDHIQSDSDTPIQVQPTSQTTPETLLITAMREHSAVLNNHAAALDRHTAAIKNQVHDTDQN